MRTKCPIYNTKVILIRFNYTTAIKFTFEMDENIFYTVEPSCIEMLRESQNISK